LTAPTIYSLALTSDPTPLYRIEVDPRPTADPVIQLFDLEDPFPLAVTRMHPYVPSVAAICTCEPAGPNAKWRPFSETGGKLVIEPVPGLPAIERGVSWKLTTYGAKSVVCTMAGGLFGYENESLRLARYGLSGPGGFKAETVFEILRGGGFECELGIVIQTFTHIEAERRKALKKGKKSR
ncbi:hypothetical protein V492_03458, partial [Pseudogymnoascus sp. VKM F-4246]